MFKRMMLLAGMALAALAFALPVSAASANWMMEGAELTENETVTFSGPASFAWAPAEAGWSTELTAEIELEVGTTTGEVKSVSATNCKGTGKLAGLTCTSTFQNLPWIVHITNGKIQITNISILNHYYLPNDPTHSTPVKTTLLTGNVLATPDNNEAIGSVSLEGEGTDWEGVGAPVSGTLAASPTGRYGIE